MLTRRHWAAGAASALILTGAVILWPQGTSATNVAPTTTAIDSAVSYGHSRGERVAVAVYDRWTNQGWLGGDANSYYASASLVKVFIAARLIMTGQMHGSIATTASRMIRLSDDDAATSLYGRVGGDQLYKWVTATFHIPVAPPPDAGFWGETRITAGGMLSFYKQIAAISGGSWLTTTMGQYSCTAADGFPQCFGIPAASATHPRIKQGWMCCLEGKTRMHSTGYVDSGRMIVVLLSEGSRSVYGTYGGGTVTGMARRVMPGGHVPLPYSYNNSTITAPPIVHPGTLIPPPSSAVPATSAAAPSAVAASSSASSPTVAQTSTTPDAPPSPSPSPTVAAPPTSTGTDPAPSSPSP
jgi:hypothetical protein